MILVRRLPATPAFSTSLVSFLVVKLVVDGLQVWVGDVGVNLGCGDIAVTEHGLNAADVGAVHEQISRK